MKHAWFGLVTALLATAAQADINDDMQKLGGAAAKGYLGPVVSTFGSNMNQGWFFEAPRPVLWGIDISARTVFIGTQFASDAETFSASENTTIDSKTADLVATQIVAGQSGLTKPQKDSLRVNIAAQLLGKSANMTIAGPTLLGSKHDEIMLTVGSKDKVAVGPDSVAIDGRSVSLGVSGAGLSGLIPGVPLVMPQVTVGTLAGTQLALRWLPEVADISFLGIGINHNPGFWFEGAQLPFGINSSIAGAWSSLSYGKFMEFTAWNAGVLASRQFGWRFLNIAPFAGVGVEGSSLKVSYTTDYLGPNGKPLEVGFDATGENFFRVTAGTKARLGILDLAGSFTMAKYSSVAMNIGLGF